VSGPYKLGALAPEIPFGLSYLSEYVQGKLPAAPERFAAPCIDTRMFDNDTLGDCTIAGVAHAITAWNAETHESDAIPTDREVRDAYFALTGGTDSGCVEATVLRKWQCEGLFGHKLAAYAPVPPQNIGAVHQAIAFYGAAYLGVALPESAQEQFPSREWTVVPGSPIEGGHCILAVGYDAYAVHCRTWGGTVAVSYPWFAKYTTEAWACIAPEFVEAGRGPVLDLASLRRDLAAL
jgi:hypothetical protein